MRRFYAAGADGSVPLEYALHLLAIKCGKWPWEWQDAPADLLMRALSIESAEAAGMSILQKRRSGR